MHVYGQINNKKVGSIIVLSYHFPDYFWSIFLKPRILEVGSKFEKHGKSEIICLLTSSSIKLLGEKTCIKKYNGRSILIMEDDEQKDMEGGYHLTVNRMQFRRIDSKIIIRFNTIKVFIVGGNQVGVVEGWWNYKKNKKNKIKC